MPCDLRTVSTPAPQQPRSFWEKPDMGLWDRRRLDTQGATPVAFFFACVGIDLALIFADMHNASRLNIKDYFLQFGESEVHLQASTPWPSQSVVRLGSNSPASASQSTRIMAV